MYVINSNKRGKLALPPETVYSFKQKQKTEIIKLQTTKTVTGCQLNYQLNFQLLLCWAVKAQRKNKKQPHASE